MTMFPGTTAAATAPNQVDCQIRSMKKHLAERSETARMRVGSRTDTVTSDILAMRPIFGYGWVAWVLVGGSQPAVDAVPRCSYRRTASSSNCQPALGLVVHTGYA